MKGNIRLIVKLIYNIGLWLYLISIAIVAYFTGDDFWFFYLSKMLTIAGIYILSGGTISVIFKLNMFTPKLRKFTDVEKNNYDFYSYINAIIYIIFGICIIILYGFIFK